MVKGQGSIVKAQGSKVKGQKSRFNCQGSRANCQGSRVKGQLSRVKGQLSRVNGQGSRVNCQGSRVKGCAPARTALTCCNIWCARTHYTTCASPHTCFLSCHACPPLPSILLITSSVVSLQFHVMLALSLSSTSIVPRDVHTCTCVRVVGTRLCGADVGGTCRVRRTGRWMSAGRALSSSSSARISLWHPSSASFPCASSTTNAPPRRNTHGKHSGQHISPKHHFS
jgi:hypothetical protein